MTCFLSTHKQQMDTIAGAKSAAQLGTKNPGPKKILRLKVAHKYFCAMPGKVQPSESKIFRSQ
jgi:hypothetical protein